MAIVTTYVCDVSGKQGVKDDFVEVTITPKRLSLHLHYLPAEIITKIVHKEVAVKLGLLVARKDEVAPEVIPTFESQLSTLLKSYISDLVYDEVANQVQNN